MQAAYYLYRLHHVMPSDFYNMGYGERAILMSFLDYEIGQRAREYGAAPAEEGNKDGKEADSRWLRSLTSYSR